MVNGMSRDEQRLRTLLSESARSYGVHEDPPDDELLHLRPKRKRKLKKPIVAEI